MPAAVAAQDYPSKPVTIVVPFTPGNSVDILGRFLAESLSRLWGQSVVVENLPGAGSSLGSAHVAQAAPDGYTVLFTASTFTINAAVRDDLPYDPEKDLTPVAMIGDSRSLLVVGSKVKARTFADFVTEAKSRETFLATPGLGSYGHVTGEMFAAATDLKLTPVHYKSGADAGVDLIGGRSDILVSSLTTALPNVESGQLHAIAVLGTERTAALPDVPTLREAGIDIVVPNLWWGVFVPAATPDPVVQKIHADIVSVMSSDAAKAFMDKQQAVIRLPGQKEFAQLVMTELAQWKALAKERGIKAE
ncbi:tripartite tricarboxylate transporter substrate-binding protein [Chelativorans sp. AA-79]|uniref:Bug family tripartite tricarboxylate transporter substrate binding protein n=1 Tax=Chelativorans sp. AA-79 TaxID=3028735 RepID=UPI0023F89EE6|nr:tripartite tricarboxylate transporter substrate-binding protein [Chelativorans sp. AA-79]WEX12470.1 tripartite tricarboxylate transporter substrate-binding protein [Chelativorans sp. AA-79]